MDTTTAAPSDGERPVDEWVDAVCDAIYPELERLASDLEGFALLQGVHEPADLPSGGSTTEVAALVSAARGHEELQQVYLDAVLAAGVPIHGSAEGRSYRDSLTRLLEFGLNGLQDMYANVGASSSAFEVFAVFASFDEFGAMFAEHPDFSALGRSHEDLSDAVGDAWQDLSSCERIDDAYFLLGEHVFYTVHVSLPFGSNFDALTGEDS